MLALRKSVDPACAAGDCKQYRRQCSELNIYYKSTPGAPCYRVTVSLIMAAQFIYGG